MPNFSNPNAIFETNGRDLYVNELIEKVSAFVDVKDPTEIRSLAESSVKFGFALHKVYQIW